MSYLTKAKKIQLKSDPNTVMSRSEFVNVCVCFKCLYEAGKTKPDVDNIN